MIAYLLQNWNHVLVLIVASVGLWAVLQYGKDEDFRDDFNDSFNEADHE